MITKIELEGFKSFGSPSQIIPLTRLNVLVGANASGKSNLIGALRFLKDCVMHNVDYAVNELGGTVQVRNKIQRQRAQEKPLRIRMEVELPGEIDVQDKGARVLSQWKFDYEMALDLRRDDGAPLIISEKLDGSYRDAGQKRSFYLHRDAEKVEYDDPTVSRSVSSEFRSIPSQEVSRLALGVGFFSLPIVLLRAQIENWHFFNISPFAARLPYKEIPDVALGPAGENLAVVLKQIEQNKKALSAIVATLKTAVPGFKGIKTSRLPIEGKRAFQILEHRIRTAVNPEAASDGTIRLLTLAVITGWVSRTATLVTLEEPENGVHPHLAEQIVELLRESSSRTQVLVTTHEPDFLDFLEPSQVLLVDKITGLTAVKPASSVGEIDGFRKTFSLGELWEQGVLGGTP